MNHEITPVTIPDDDAQVRVEPSAVTSRSLDSTLFTPRQVIIYLLRECSTLTHAEIGQVFGGWNDINAVYLVELVRRLQQPDRELWADIQAIKAALR